MSVLTMDMMKEELSKLNHPQTENNSKRTRNSQDVDLRRLKSDQNVRIRFIADGDETNHLFWRALTFHKLVFNGIKGDASKSNVRTFIRVPAYNRTITKFNKIVEGGILPVPEDMIYTNKEDPIQMYISQNDLYHKNTELYNSLNRTTVYLAQGFIVEAPQDLEPYNKSPRLLRHFTFGKDIIDIFQLHINDNECKNDIPVDNKDGVDFIFHSELVGKNNSHKKSKFLRTHTSITPEMANDLLQNGYDIIRNRLFNKPNNEEIDVIKTMLEAYLGGLPFDPEWANYYKPVAQFVPKDQQQEVTEQISLKEQEINDFIDESKIDVPHGVNLSKEPEIEEPNIETKPSVDESTASVNELIKIIESKI